MNTPFTPLAGQPPQQPCLLWLVGQGAFLVRVPVGPGGSDGVVGTPCLSLGMLTADTSTTLVWAWAVRFILMVPCCPRPLQTITQCVITIMV